MLGGKLWQLCSNQHCFGPRCIAFNTYNVTFNEELTACANVIHAPFQKATNLYFSCSQAQRLNTIDQRDRVHFVTEQVRRCTEHEVRQLCG